MRPTLVLLADDESHITRVVGAKLRAAGYQTACAADGEEALIAARQQLPGLIVTDLQMPRMSGLDLALRLKESPATASIPLILLTARGHVLDEADVARTSIRRVMSKPFSAREILRLAEELIGPPEAAPDALGAAA